MWVDAHCHVQSDYAKDHDGDTLIARARAAGVDWMVCVGTDLTSSRQAIELAHRHHDVYATVGLHPHDAQHFGSQWKELIACASQDRVVGIGEAGFDLYYEHSPRDEQRTAFVAQIELANELDRALVIHTREAWDDTFAVLQTVGVPRRTVVHCFSGGPREAQRALDLGCWLSYSGIVSFKAAVELRAAAAITPLDRILVETDSPYLAPVPHRGRANEPGFVGAVGVALAAACGQEVDVIATVTAANAATVFGVSSQTEAAGLQVDMGPR